MKPYGVTKAEAIQCKDGCCGTGEIRLRRTSHHRVAKIYKRKQRSRARRQKADAIKESE